MTLLGGVHREVLLLLNAAVEFLLQRSLPLLKLFEQLHLLQECE